MWFSCSLGGNWNDPPVPSCWKSTIEHGNGSNSHHGHFICLKLCRCRGDTQQKYPMTQIVERGHRQERCRHQQSALQQDDILDTAVCHHLRRFVHHLPTICGVQWSIIEQSQFANIFSVLATFVFLSVVNIGAVWPWWPASCCQLSTQCQHRYRRRGKIFFGRYISNYFLYIYLLPLIKCNQWD